LVANDVLQIWQVSLCFPPHFFFRGPPSCSLSLYASFFVAGFCVCRGLQIPFLTPQISFWFPLRLSLLPLPRLPLSGYLPFDPTGLSLLCSGFTLLGQATVLALRNPLLPGFGGLRSVVAQSAFFSSFYVSSLCCWAFFTAPPQCEPTVSHHCLFHPSASQFPFPHP